MSRHLPLLLITGLAVAGIGAPSSVGARGAVSSLSTGAIGASSTPGSAASGGGGGSTAAAATLAAPAAAGAMSPVAGVSPTVTGGGARTLDLARDTVEATRLAALAPDADPEIISLAVRAMHCAQRGGVAPDAKRLAVIDYGRSSRQERLWLFDLESGELLFRELVAHGKNSGEDRPTKFSNVEGSLQTSLGLFVTGETYQGANGYSMRMEGLEAGFNDAAMSRAIVMHGAPYVDAAMAGKMGRLGRSWGCPAVRDEIATEMIDSLKGGQFIFSYYPDDAWKTQSALINCAG